MSASRRASARHRPGGARRLLGLLTLLPLVGGLAIGGASAQPPPAVIRLSAAEARQAGVSLSLWRHDQPGAELLEVSGPASPGNGSRLLAVAPDGRAVALAAAPLADDGELTIAEADGAQLRVSLPGLNGAAFAPEGDRLAVIDGGGALWSVDAGSGAAHRLADGPFVGSPVFAGDGSLLLLAASSVEAPYRSRLVRLVIGEEATAPLTDDELVYAVLPLDDGARAMVVHEHGETVVKRLHDGASTLMEVLGPDATEVSVSSDGARIAFERGNGVFLVEGHGSLPRRVGDGSAPMLSPDGRLLLLRRGVGWALLAADGSLLAEYDGLVAFIGCDGGCRP